MKIQICNALTLFIFLINTMSVHGMEHNNNDLHPLVSLPSEVQHRIIFPLYTQSTKITFSKMNELEEVVRIFFKFKRVCKQFNQCVKFPWSDWTTENKEKMVKKVMDFAFLDPNVFRLYVCIKHDGNAQAQEAENTQLINYTRDLK